MTKNLFLCLLLLVSASACVPAVRGPEVLEGGVRFTYDAPAAKSVAIAGSFNRWSPSRDFMAGPDKNGRWSILLPLGPGRYEYLFVVNGSEWTPDPGAPREDDGLGGRNSVVIVPRAAEK